MEAVRRAGGGEMPDLEAEGVLVGAKRDPGDRRRIALLLFHMPERRLGYDRRRLASSPIEQFLHGISVRDGLALGLIAGVVAANLLDVLLTGALLQRGATEANGFLLGVMMTLGTPAAFAVKMLACVSVAALVWALRRYRSAAILLVAWFGTFALLNVYQACLFMIR